MRLANWFGRITPLRRTGATQPVSAMPARWWFFRLLGVAYLAAFWSLSTQIVGLIGHDGILPAAEYMDRARAFVAAQHIGLDRFRLLPTICWLGAGDAVLRALCLGGVALAALLVCGVVPAVVLPLLWIDYLSLSVVGRDFLAFQWDALLLETGLIAVFIAPLTLLDRPGSRVLPVPSGSGMSRWRVDDSPRVGVWLMLWLLFRLMFGSGVAKLTSGDETWRNLTALTFHYETQPIPTPLAWYAHQLPAWFSRGSTAAALAIELVAPFLIVGPRRLRRVAFVVLVGLQGVIALTGNYAFFNLLAAALCLFLLDEAPLTPGNERPSGVGFVVIRRVRGAAAIVLAVVTVPISTLAFASRLGIEPPEWSVVTHLAELAAPLRSVNAYGLFAVMTTMRPEIIVEGSDDRVEWKAYGFAYKPGDLSRRPPWVAPHQPRLDWQMWFAALGRYDDEPWFQRFCQRLLEGSPQVLRLLAHDPFGGRAPRYLRATLYRYRFSDPTVRRTRGVWWTRERLGDYAPVLSLDAAAPPVARD